MALIIGGGLAGLSCSFHIGHDQCTVLEKNAHLFGHAVSEQAHGFTWDQGPHVSFTKHAYVRDLFARSVGGDFDEYPVRVSNHYRGHWIDHPAQTSLHQLPADLRERCLQSFLVSRDQPAAAPPADYLGWLVQAFGNEFANRFPAAYTRKYWTVEPEELGTDWVGGRVLNPSVEAVVAGSRGPLPQSTHYISTVRYPRHGGYQSFARAIAQGCRVQYGAEVIRIDLARRRVWLANGACLPYDRLINSMPLPLFVNACTDVPLDVRDAADALSCSQLMLVNIGVDAPSPRPEHWIYVYDEDLLSTRLSFTERLTAGNAPAGWTGVQSEVYFSRHKPLPVAPAVLGERVLTELIDIGVLPSESRALVAAGRGRVDVRYAPWANVIFHRQTALALEVIWRWLERFGLAREQGDTAPLTDWTTPRPPATPAAGGSIHMAGRFGQWKYFWSDDCIMRGLELGRALGVGTPAGS